MKLTEKPKVVGRAVHETIDENGETIGFPVWTPSEFIMEGKHIYKRPKRGLNGNLKKQEQNRNKQEAKSNLRIINGRQVISESKYCEKK